MTPATISNIHRIIWTKTKQNLVHHFWSSNPLKDNSKTLPWALLSRRTVSENYYSIEF